MKRPTSYMTAAQYEAYGAVDELDAEVARVRRAIERDWRGRRIEVSSFPVLNAYEQLESAMHAWDEEDEDAPTVDEMNASRKPR